MEIRKQKGKQVGRLTVTEQIDQKHQEDLQRLRSFRLLDDDFLTKCFEGDTAIGKLMHDFACTDAADMYYRTLADRVRFFKKSKEGIEIMCRAMEDMRNQTLKEGMKEVALRMLMAGKYALEEIVNISGLSLEEVKQLKADRSA